MIVDPRQHRGLLLKQLHQLRPAHAQHSGGFGGVVIQGGEGVQGLGEHHGEVGVVFVQSDAFGLDAGLPKIAWTVREVDGAGHGSVLDGELEAEAFESDTFVVGLAPSFAGTGGNAGGCVGQLDGGLDFVSVLATGAGGAGSAGGALLEQGLIIEAGGMALGVAWQWVGHGRMVSQVEGELRFEMGD